MRRAPEIILKSKGAAPDIDVVSFPALLVGDRLEPRPSAERGSVMTLKQPPIPIRYNTEYSGRSYLNETSQCVYVRCECVECTVLVVSNV